MASWWRWHLHWAVRVRLSFYMWSCVLGGAALWEEPKRAQNWAVLGNTEAHTWLFCVAARRENVG